MIQRGMQMSEDVGKVVEGRIAAEVLLEHSSGSRSNKKLKTRELTALKHEKQQYLKDQGYRFIRTQRACMKETSLSDAGAAYMERAMQELSVGEEVDGVCRERAGE